MKIEGDFDTAVETLYSDTGEDIVKITVDGKTTQINYRDQWAEILRAMEMVGWTKDF